MIAVRIPCWAAALGMPPPHDDETFETYWNRMGVGEQIVAMALANLDPRAEDVANDRMADYVRRACPRSFTAYVNSFPTTERYIPKLRYDSRNVEAS